MVKKPNEEFQLVVTTKQTKFGPMDFHTTISPVDDLTDITVVGDGGMEETIFSISDDHKKTLSVQSGRKGKKYITIDTDNTDIEAGMIVDLEDGDFCYIKEIDGNRVKLKTRLPKTLDAKDYKQCGNTGVYYSDKASISEPGDYMMIATNPKYGLFVSQRVSIVEDTTCVEDDEVIAVAH